MLKRIGGLGNSHAGKTVNCREIKQSSGNISNLTTLLTLVSTLVWNNGVEGRDDLRF